ncbi:MAG: right-handed parallel beta-helix repeat-containing protein, partial [Ferruginibacter sp.]
MKFLITLMLLFCTSVVTARNFYISATGNDANDGLSPATAWKTIAKLNASFDAVAPGDAILFKCDETFYGSIVIGKSGAKGNPITIGSYGTGAKPLISGLITLSSWSSAGNGVYQASAPAVKNTVNLVTLNGTPQAVGRYPNIDAANGGYLTYESTSGPSSITDAQLTTAINWTGAEVVVKKNLWLLERCKITGQSGGTINFTALPSINPSGNSNPSTAPGTDGHGYFIQRDPRTLDQLGEWYFNTSTKNMQMYFGTSSPSAYSIRVSTLDTLINIGNKNYININNIAFEGANLAAVYANNAGNITIESCDMNAMGGKGVFIFNSPNILIDGVTTNNVLCNAFDVTNRHQDNVTIRNCAVNNTAMLPGMGSFWDDNDYKAISVSVNSGALVEYNNVVNTGYVGIQFQGNNVLIKNNFVNYYDIVKDDGGGIYTYQSGTDAAPGLTYTGRVIRNNIVLNGIGTTDGTGHGSIDVDGIYLDGRTGNVDVLDNTVAHIGVHGIYSNNAKNVNIIGNTAFDNGSSIGITRYAWGSISNLAIKRNIFYPKYNTQNNFNYTNTGVNVPAASTIQAAMQQIGNIDSNYYSIPNAAGFSYYYSLVQGGSWIFASPLSFEGWKSFTNHDKATKLPPKKLDAYKLNSLTSGNMFLNSQFNSNISGVVAWSANNNQSSSWDNTGKINGTGSMKIIPASSTSDYTYVYGSIGAVSSAKKYIIRFTTLGTTSNGVLRAYIRKSASPNTILTPIETANFGTSKTTHEFLFTAPTTAAAASFMIEIQQSSGTVYLDDIELYEADATPLNIDDQIRFEYNATKAVKTFTLDASYLGVDNTVYNGSITLQPYTSKILMRNGPATAITP